MKKIEAIVKPGKLEELKEAMFAINIEGITVYQVMGCGNQLGWKEYYRGTEVLMNVLPKVKIEIIVADEKAEKIIDTIIKIANTGEIGDGKIFVSDIMDCVRVRTGERGEKAL